MRQIFSLIYLILLFEGCSVDIDPSASNSASAILAIFGEYTFAILSLFLFYILRAITIIGGGIITIGVIHIFNKSPFLNISPTYILLLGVIVILIGFLQPNNPYKPQIVIAHKSWKRKSTPTNKRRNKISEILIQIISGVATGFILHLCGIQ